MSTNLKPAQPAPTSTVKLKTSNVKPPAPPQMPRQKFVRGALNRGTAPSGARTPQSSANLTPPISSPSAAMVPPPSPAPSASFNPPSDVTDPATARAPRAPVSPPAAADPMDAAGTDPYSSSLTDDTGMPSYKKGGLVKRRGWGIARG